MNRVERVLLLAVCLSQAIVAVAGARSLPGTGIDARAFNNTLATLPIPIITSFSPTVGKPGASVQIFGTMFTGVGAVTFNGHPATFVFINDGEVDAVVPAAATTGFIVIGVGPESGISPSVFTVDITPPAAPTITGASPPSPSSNPSPLISGTAEANSTVSLYRNGVCSGIPAATTTADGSGNFSVNVLFPSNATTSLTATATDAAENISTCSSVFTYTTDTIPPSTLTLTGSSPPSPANNNTPHILGTTEPGASVTLYSAPGCSGPPAGTGTANGSGHFSIQVTVGDNTSTTFTAVATDAAGNPTPCSISSFTYVEDSNLPDNSICGRKFNDVNGNGTYEPGLGETALAGWTIFAVSKSGDTLTTQTDLDGSYCFFALPDTSYRVFESMPDGYIQTAGEPYYTVSLSAGSHPGSIDFGNFKLGEISGMKFNDLNGDGVHGAGEPGMSGWTICLLPQQLPPRFDLDHADANVYMTLNAFPAFTSAQLTGRLALGFGTEVNLETPMNGTAFFKSVSGLGVETEVVEYKPGGVSSGFVKRSGLTYSTSFDVFLEVVISSGGGTHYVTHLPIHLAGDGGTPRPSPGNVLRGGPVSLYDKLTGNFGGTLDSFVVVVGSPISQADPICDTTSASGAYQFTGLLPGMYNVREELRECWLPTTPLPPTSTVLSGDSLTVVFGNQAGGATLCVRKYYDENHNQQLDPGEHPMAGVTFHLTGSNPLNTFSSVTDNSGRACFQSLPADYYALTEVVPPGYDVILPKGGVSFFTVSGCGEDSVLWLNAAKYTDSTFRTATPEQWATSTDPSGKRKSVKCKPDKVDFVFNMKFRLGLLTMKFPFLTSGEVRIGKNNPNAPVVSSWTDLKTVQIDFDTIPAPGQVIEFTGRGDKGKLITLSYQWTIPGGGLIDKGTLPAKPSNAEDVIKQNFPRLPMPNLHNVGEDLQRLFKFPVIVGSATGLPYSVIHPKYADVLKTFAKQTPGGLLFHTDSTHCLDLIKGKPIKHQLRAYPPDAFGGNRLVAEVLALQMNILASETGRFPPGLEDLIYDDSAVDPSPLDSATVGDILNQANEILICGSNPKLLNLLPVEYFSIVRKINLAFSSSEIDTESWSCTNLALTGVRSLKSIRYLRANPGTINPSAHPVLQSYSEEPFAYKLQQNYPNPFNPTTTIQFELFEPARISLKVYNTLGQEIATLIDNQQMDDGISEVEFDASHLTSGVYFYRIIADGIGDPEEGIAGKHFVSVKKMLLVK